MPTDSLNEREFELINIIGEKLGANQRDLSKELAISLGTTNLLIRRLVAKGYIRIRQLNKKKTQYILTPKGFSEKYQKSIKYTLKTIRSIGLIRQQLDLIIERLYLQGERDFLIHGHSDLTELVEMCLGSAKWTGVKFSRTERLPEHPSAIILICSEEAVFPQELSHRYVDLIQQLAVSRQNSDQAVSAN